MVSLKSSPATRHGGAWGERIYNSYSFTTSALDGGEWSASRPGRAFIPGERTPGIHWTGGWVGPRDGLYKEDREKILCPCRGSNLDRPVVQPVVRHYTAWANPAPKLSPYCHLIELLCFHLRYSYFRAINYTISIDQKLMCPIHF
jgi:hypothetical protein